MVESTTDGRYYTHEWSENQSWEFDAEIPCEDVNKLLHSTTPLVAEAVLSVSPDGATVRGIDPAQVAVAEATVPKVWDADGAVEVGVNVRTLDDGIPAYFRGSDEAYTLNVSHSGGDEYDDTFSISHRSEGRHRQDAYDPETVRTCDEWPDHEIPHETRLPAPKLRGALGAMADAAETYVQLEAHDGTLSVRADDDNGNWRYGWEIDADLAAGEPPIYSADYAAEIAEAVWPTGDVTLRFGRDARLEIETDFQRFAQAPRVMDE